jgi:adenosine deaminase
MADATLETTLDKAAWLEFLQRMPKVELHAHLNGSLPFSILRDFAAEDSATREQNAGVSEPEVVLTTMPPPASVTAAEKMAWAFRVFDTVHRLVRTRDRLRRGALAVLEAFRQDGVMYLELRTTPKSLPDGTTDAEYVECVVDAMSTFCAIHSDFKCRLLLSINRKGGPDHAARVVDLTIKFRDELAPWVVGVDFSGDCYQRTFAEYVPALQRARDAGIPLTVHAGEKPDELELAQMLDFAPERIGHLVFAGPAAKQRVRDGMLTRDPPLHLELCITSNMLTCGWEFPWQHHIVNWCLLDAGHSVSVNTDDCGVFDTTLTNEFWLFTHAVERALACERHDGPAEAHGFFASEGVTGSHLTLPDAACEVRGSTPDQRHDIVELVRRAVLNAIGASFVSTEERESLAQRLLSHSL